MEVSQFSPILPPLPDTPRGISETPMVRVPATASLLRAFQPRSSDSLLSVYSGLRPIYATLSHPQTLNPAHLQSLRSAKLRSGSGSPNARSCLENRERSFHLSQNENHHFTLVYRGVAVFMPEKLGDLQPIQMLHKALAPTGHYDLAHMETRLPAASQVSYSAYRSSDMRLANTRPICTEP